MADKVIKKVEIVRIAKISNEITDLWIEDAEIASYAKAGQFISIYCKDGSRLLPRPISICEIDQEKNRIRLVFRIQGEGTKEIASCLEQEELTVLGPLGNGFTNEEKTALIIGGGIGIPPLLQLCKELNAKKHIVLGYRNQDLFLMEEFKALGTVYTATEDGSFGIKGNVIDAIKEHGLLADMIYACGPLPMLKGVKEFAKEHRIKAQISMEERMACGIGACLACVCQSKGIDEHSHVANKRVCKDGPVFDSEAVEL